MVRKPLEIFNLSVVFNVVCLINVLDLTALRPLMWSFIVVLDILYNLIAFAAVSLTLRILLTAHISASISVRLSYFRSSEPIMNHRVLQITII